VIGFSFRLGPLAIAVAIESVRALRAEVRRESAEARAQVLAPTDEARAEPGW
jgi:hypothetical protein